MRRIARPPWLKSSAVKKIVYHATNAEDFTAFDVSRGDLGAHFGTLDQANYIAEHRRDGDGARIIPAWLFIRRPLRLKDVGTFHADGIARQLERKGIIPRGEGKRIERECDTDWRKRKVYDAQLRDAIVAAGYDGVVYKNGHEGAGDSYIVFHPGQVKSATGNKGTFDRESVVMTNPRGIFNVRLASLLTPDWKLQETLHDISDGKLSWTRGPLTVTKAGHGRYLVMNGNHRALEGLMAGMTEYPAELDAYVPDLTRTGGAHDSVLRSAVPLSKGISRA
jgi:hypothetical protein